MVEEKPRKLVSALGNFMLQSSPAVERNFSKPYINHISQKYLGPVQCHMKLCLLLVSWYLSHLQRT